MRFPTLFVVLVFLGFASGLTLGCGDDSTSPGSGVPKVILVKPDGTGDQPTIQAAINAAAEGDTVQMAVGVFRGEGNRDIDFRGRAIVVTSQSAEPGESVIDCQGNGRGFYFHLAEGSDTVLKGIKVINGSASSGGAVLCTDTASPTITDCIFTGNSGAQAGGGLHIHDNCSPTITDCIISENSSQANGGGAYCSESFPSFVNCTFQDNTAVEGGAISCYNSSLMLRGCTFSENSPDGIVCGSSMLDAERTLIAYSTEGAGLTCLDDCIVVLACCDVYGNAGGDSTECIVDEFGIDGNISLPPLFCDRDGGDLRLQPSSPCSSDSSACGLIGAWPVGCD